MESAFGEYGGLMAKTLSDRVTHFFTINEFQQVTETAYRGVELHVQGKTVRLMGAAGSSMSPERRRFVNGPSQRSGAGMLNRQSGSGPQACGCGPAASTSTNAS